MSSRRLRFPLTVTRSFSRQRWRSNTRSECLEIRCLPAVSHLVSGTSVTISANGNDQFVVADDGTHLTYSVAGEAPKVVSQLNASNITVLNINGTNPVGNNKITLKLSAALLSVLSKAQVSAGGGNDTVDASESDVLVSIDGGVGNDVLIGGQAVTGGTTVNVPAVGPPNRTYQLQDTLLGGLGNDVLFGGAGNDSLLGGLGNDTMSGEVGNDFLFGDLGDDKLAGGVGNDTVSGGAGRDSVSGGDDNDYVYGGAGNDTVSGGQGLDVVKGQEGQDQIEGSLEAAQSEVTTLNTVDRLAVGTRRLDPLDLRSEFFAGLIFDLSFIPDANAFR